MPQEQTFFLGRQPILDVRQEIVGYELLFRSSENNFSDFESQNQACMSVISSALSGFGFNEILGDKAGFINITEEVLFSELIELLPQEQTILEILESVPLNGETRDRCLSLQSRGYRIALDDHVFAAEHRELYRFVNIVKIDILETIPGMLPGIAEGLNKYPVQLLAEKVETLEQFYDCLALGFELFQGYFFSRPIVLKQKRLEPSKIAMLRLLGNLHADADFGTIEDSFRTAPELSFNLLKLVNSVCTGLREKIRSLRHAIMILGLDRLRRWVQLAIFASSDRRGINNPLLEMAAVRGRLMEFLVMDHHGLARNHERVEAAFMTGILSLVDVLMETTIENIVNELGLSDDISAALLNREGELGTLLSLAETLEQSNFGEVQDLVEKTDISFARLLAAQIDAYNWRESIKVS
ncbi:MAG: EAL domain-containing protein [Desulfuromonadaceae bacterium]|nr:EAL domain-containing protein [Desulfuromonadaceae bacterium]